MAVASEDRSMMYIAAGTYQQAKELAAGRKFRYVVSPSGLFGLDPAIETLWVTGTRSENKINAIRYWEERNGNIRYT